MNGCFEKRLGLEKPSKMREITPKLIEKIVSKLSFIDKVKLRIEGSLFIDNLLFEGWSRETPVYLFKCKHHGYEVSYPSGHYMKLHCYDCIAELNQMKFSSENTLKKNLFRNKYKEDVEARARGGVLEQILDAEN